MVLKYTKNRTVPFFLSKLTSFSIIDIKKTERFFYLKEGSVDKKHDDMGNPHGINDFLPGKRYESK